VIENTENLGFIRGVNQGFSFATGDQILLLDADTELRYDTISQMYIFLEEHSEVVMVVPRTINPDGTIQETARRFPSIINGFLGRQSFLTRLFPNNPFSKRYLDRNNLENRNPFQVEFVSAACIMFRKTVLNTVGFLDEGFSKYAGYWSDADWCNRIQKAGGIIYCVPQAVILHHEQNKPFRKINSLRIIEFHKGVFRLYRLHYTLGKWDSRILIAALLLTARTLLLLTAKILKKAPESSVDPLSRQK